MTTADSTRSPAVARQSPRVSVVLPVFNGEPFLDAAVNSVLAQTFGDFELIAIDDGSTDATAAILDRLAQQDRRVIVVRRAKAGIVAALNHGLALARGEFIARMDADDVACPERFVRQAAFLDAHADVAVVGSAITLIDAQGRTIRDVHYPESPEAVAEFLHTGSALAHPAVMMRREAVMVAGGYRSAYRYAEDYDLWLRLVEHQNLANLPDRLLLYRQHEAKQSIVHASEQALATSLARIAARRRRHGQPEPAIGPQSLSLADLHGIDLSRQERSVVTIDIVDNLLALDRWQERPVALERAIELFAQADADALPRPRLVRTKLKMAYGSARRGRLVTAGRWLGQAVAGRRGDARHAGAMLLDRARRLIASIRVNRRRV